MKLPSDIRPLHTRETAPHLYKYTNTMYTDMPLETLYNRGIRHPILESLTKELADQAWICGGALCSLMSYGLSDALNSRPNTPENPAFNFPGDIDFYFGSELAFRETLLDFLEYKPNWAYEGYELETDLSMLNSNAYVTFVSTLPNRPKIQLIKIGWLDSPVHTIDNFDFTVVQFAVDRHKLYYNPMSMLDVAGRQLIIHQPDRDPMSTLRRMVKYASRGFKVSAATLAQIPEAEKKAIAGNGATLNSEATGLTSYRPAPASTAALNLMGAYVPVRILNL